MLESYENLFTEGLHIKHKFIKGFFYEKNLLEYSENRQRLKLRKNTNFIENILAKSKYSNIEGEWVYFGNNKAFKDMGKK